MFDVVKFQESLPVIINPRTPVSASTVNIKICSNSYNTELEWLTKIVEAINFQYFLKRKWQHLKSTIAQTINPIAIFFQRVIFIFDVIY
jgi:hypothetical protein